MIGSLQREKLESCEQRTELPPNHSESFALLGCTVAPGFDFEDFEMPDRDQLLRQFAQHRPIIEMLTKSM